MLSIQISTKNKISQFVDFIWSLSVAIFFPALAAVTVTAEIARAMEIDTATYAITILRLFLGMVFIAIGGMFIIKRSNI